MLRKVVPAQVLQEGLGDDEVEIRMSTGALGRDGHVLVPHGAELANYRANPIILWQHDPGAPVGRASAISVVNDPIGGDHIAARVNFAPAGISHKADEVRGLVKSGVVSAVSVGFDPIDGEPLDPKRPRSGQRFTRWELLECSFVSVPADPGAMVTARAMEGEEGAAAADGAQAASGEAHPPGRGQTMIRGMYAVAQLAWLFDSLCNAHSCSEFEEALEGDDDSVFPALLMAVKKDLGEALIAMTVEEVGEMCGEDDAIDGGGPMMMTAQAKLQRFRAGYLRAGKALSAANADRLGQAQGHHDQAMEHHGAAERCHRSIGERCDGLMDRCDGLRAAHEKMGEQLEALKDQHGRAVPGDTTDPLDRCLRAHRAMARNLDAIADHNTGLGDDHEALGDAHRGIARHVRAAARCVRAVGVPGDDPDDDEDDSQQIQTSAGTAESTGSAGDRDYRRRQAELLALSAA